MTLDQALKQLQSNSPQALEGVIRHILRGGFGEQLPDPLATALVKHWEHSPLPDGVSAAVVTDFPSPAFRAMYTALLARGDPETKARALQRVRPWLETASVRFEDIAPTIAGNVQADSFWIRFLSWLQLARYGSQPETAWARAAEAILDADQHGWPQSIRDRAVEVLDAGELAAINRELSARDSRTLPPATLPHAPRSTPTRGTSGTQT